MNTEWDEKALGCAADSVKEEEPVTEEQEEEEAETGFNLLPGSHDTNGLVNWGCHILIIVFIAVVVLYLFTQLSQSKNDI
ncbi:hypothetical protein DTX79_16400 [Bacilli bacterium]|nr:hypothetical protein DTX79_16400 [Bacilli bacterium]